MNNLRYAAVVSLVLLGLAIPAGALAHRPAIRAEKAAMVYDASARYYGGISVNARRSAPLRCFVADIATVAAGSRWGAWTFSRYAFQHQRQCRTGNGLAIEHKIGRRWYVFWEGDEGYPPTRKKREGSLTLQGVPRPVAKDLRAGLG